MAGGLETQGSWARSSGRDDGLVSSTASHGGNDLDPVTGLDRRFGMSGARHDLAVAFDRDPFAGKAEVGNQLIDAGTGRDGVGLAVEDDFHRAIVGEGALAAAPFAARPKAG